MTDAHSSRLEGEKSRRIVTRGRRETAPEGGGGADQCEGALVEDGELLHGEGPGHLNMQLDDQPDDHPDQAGQTGLGDVCARHAVSVATDLGALQASQHRVVC